MVSTCIQEELAHVVVEGIQYEKIGGSIYELRELQEDGLEEKDRFLDQLYKVTNTEKTDFDTLSLTLRSNVSLPSTWTGEKTFVCL